MIPGPNWARRNDGPHHRRLCARPGCGAPAAATLRFQPTQREAWLVELDDAASRTEGDLCGRHASSLVLPRGWQLHDERALDPDATTEPAAPKRRARGASIARARRRRGTREELELPGLTAVPIPEPITPQVSEISLGTDDVTSPALEELAEVLDAQTPLLRRAFQNVWPLEEN